MKTNRTLNPNPEVDLQKQTKGTKKPVDAVSPRGILPALPPVPQLFLPLFPSLPSVNPVSFFGIKRTVLVALIALSTLNLQLSTSFTQGPLAPPGAPAPVMKSLAQIEPRIAVGTTTTPDDADSLFRITNAGSYYLVGNIVGASNKHGLKITSGDVSVDLGGHTMIGNAGTSNGIYVLGSRTNIVIRNGTVRGWANSGIDAQLAYGSLFEHLQVTTNGTVSGLHRGLAAGPNSRVINCAALANRGVGIFANVGCVVSQCTSGYNADDGISARHGSLVTGCAVSQNGANGIRTETGCLIRDRTTRGNGGDGINTSSDSTVAGCTATANTGDGIQVSGSCLITENHCRGNGNGAGLGAGIRAIFFGSRIDGNSGWKTTSASTWTAARTLSSATARPATRLLPAVPITFSPARKPLARPTTSSGPVA